MNRRNDETRSRRWLALLAAFCLAFQALSSGIALGACASPSLADDRLAATNLQQPSEKEPGGSGGHERGHAPDCCFFACHLLTAKVAPSTAALILGPLEPAIVGLPRPDRNRGGETGDERLPQNPRAPPLPV